MKDRESRDAMVARVNKVFKEFRTFESLPVTQKHGNVAEKVADDTQKTYVEKLFVVCAIADVIGRRGESIIGERF